MGAAWLKMIGTTEDPCPEVYAKAYADFAKRPRRVKSGDGMILYAVGGRKCVFAHAEVASNVYASGRKRWPYRVDLRYKVNLPLSSGVHISAVSTPRRDLLKSVRQASYVELAREEYSQAVNRLRAASGSPRT